MRPPCTITAVRAMPSNWENTPATVMAATLMNALLDVVGEDEDHALSGLLELVGDLVSRWEREHFSITPTSPNESLQFLMKACGLKQEELSTVLPQSNLSAILSGKRKISASLAGKFGKFFGVSPSMFIPR